jgi:hypothetical protein
MSGDITMSSGKLIFDADEKALVYDADKSAKPLIYQNMVQLREDTEEARIWCYGESGTTNGYAESDAESDSFVQGLYAAAIADLTFNEDGDGIQAGYFGNRIALNIFTDYPSDMQGSFRVKMVAMPVRLYSTFAPLSQVTDCLSAIRAGYNRRYIRGITPISPVTFAGEMTVHFGVTFDEPKSVADIDDACIETFDMIKTGTSGSNQGFFGRITDADAINGLIEADTAKDSTGKTGQLAWLCGKVVLTPPLLDYVPNGDPRAWFGGSQYLCEFVKQVTVS